MKSFLLTTTEKIIKKSPMNYSLARNLECLSPKQIVDKPHSAKRQMGNLLTHLIDNRWLTTSEAEVVDKQYGFFCDHVSNTSSEIDAFKSFAPKVDSLDSFLHERLSNANEYSALWDMCQYLLIISHGQATVERGFSFNKEAMNTNMKQHTLISRRLIIDHVQRVSYV